MSNISLQIENISKRYLIGRKVSASLSETAGKFINYFSGGRDRKSTSVFWALKDVSFSVKEGEVVGIIGKNGAGKSTLLKILSRITEPTKGRIEINGRVASLLEVGTGFHPELTGRENIYLNGTILGMSRREVKSKFDEIVDFSGVERFIDTPVKRYSSGMYVRLAFAVAAHLEPEILLVDEVLAVGDAEFQKKCLGKMNEVSQSGRTILFVSHNMGAISELCSRAVFLQNGGVKMDDEVNKVLGAYLEDYEDVANSVEITSLPDSICVFNKVMVAGEDGKSRFEYLLGDPIQVHISYAIRGDYKDFNIEFNLFRGVNCVFTTFNTDTGDPVEYWRKGKYSAVVQIPGGLLKAGHYVISLKMRRNSDGAHLHGLHEVVGFKISEVNVNLTHVGYQQDRAGDIIFPGNWNIIKQEK